MIAINLLILRPRRRRRSRTKRSAMINAYNDLQNALDYVEPLNIYLSLCNDGYAILPTLVELFLLDRCMPGCPIDNHFVVRLIWAADPNDSFGNMPLFLDFLEVTMNTLLEIKLAYFSQFCHFCLWIIQ